MKQKTICYLWILIGMLFFCACGAQKKETSAPKDSEVSEAADAQTLRNAQKDWNTMEVEHSMELQYAKQFTVDYYDDGYALITIVDGGRFLVVPEQMEIPENLEEDIVILQQPLDHIYLVATSAMDLFRAIDGIGNIRLSGTDASGWYIEEAKTALEEGNMLYAGKYSAPDYELILSNDCDLAVESTMIYHSPEVKEQLEQFGIPVLVERSSYESHPLGRMEWMKLYAVLLDKEEVADAYFEEQIEGLGDLFEQENTGKTVAFFYISSNGYANVRKPGDYVAKMIKLAGGRYIFDSIEGEEENALATMNMEMETFYAGVKDADYLIYSSSIDSEVGSIEELLQKSELLADFKAVKNGNVWCTQKNMFQESTGFGDMIRDIHAMLTQDDENLTQLTYLYRLQ